MPMYQHLRDEAVALLRGKPRSERAYALTVIGEQFETELEAFGLPKEVVIAASRAWTVEVLTLVEAPEGDS